MKQQFLDIFSEFVHRPGSAKLLEWMETTDFFTAPASTRFHAAYEGGLLEHSLNVFNRAFHEAQKRRGCRDPLAHGRL